MANHLRWRVPGGVGFFAIDLLQQRSDLLVQHFDALREAKSG